MTPARTQAGDVAGLFLFLRFYFGAPIAQLGAILRDLAEREVLTLAEPRPDDGGRLVRLTCARNGCKSAIDVPDDEARAAARMNVNGWIATEDDRLVCPRCVPRAMRAGLA